MNVSVLLPVPLQDPFKMPPELEQYYNELFETFQTPGWKHFQEYVQMLYNSHVEKGWDLPTSELGTNKGIVQNLKLFRHFQEEHETAFQQIQEQDSEESD